MKISTRGQNAVRFMLDLAAYNNGEPVKLLPEALPSIIKNITVTAISVLGFSAMAGLVGGGGLGDLAYRYGYQRYQTGIYL